MRQQVAVPAVYIPEDLHDVRQNQPGAGGELVIEDTDAPVNPSWIAPAPLELATTINNELWISLIGRPVPPHDCVF